MAYEVREFPITGTWNVEFGNDVKTSDVEKLLSWSASNDSRIKYYAGTAFYRNSFIVDRTMTEANTVLKFDSIFNIATIKINGINCGTIWTAPYKLDITKAIKPGENKVEIEVTNTWHNRLIGDAMLPPEKRITWTTAPFRLKDKPLLPAGLVGDVKLIIK
jgi:hypothetical protein